MTRVGIGYDVHQLKKGELLYIGGIHISSDVGSVGHSDGDALSHSIVDALLGAAGLGDIGKLFLETTNNNKIICVDPNKGMINKGKIKLNNYKNIDWIIAPAEKLPIKDNSCDYYTISFGLRNTKNLDKALSEAYRVLKPGGRYLCLEFSKINNSGLDFIYKKYSKLIPLIGKAVVGQKNPYEYLVKSIEEFISQEDLVYQMKKNKFINCSYRNLSGGIVAIHSGWKI